MTGILNPNGEYGYGTYQTLGTLTVSISGVSAQSYYNRTLDLDTGIHATSFQGSDGEYYSISIYCSNPDSICVYDITSSGVLPLVTVFFGRSFGFPEFECGPSYTRLSGNTQTGPPLGMKYEATATVDSSLTTICSNSTGQLTIPSNNQISKLTIRWSAGTDYDIRNSDEAHNYSFRGSDPAEEVQRFAFLEKDEALIRQDHVKDFSSLMGTFTLNLPDTGNSAGVPTSTLILKYEDAAFSDPHTEKLLFDYGRYLFISSSRNGTLPPNLQGLWATESSQSWGSDYHANINLQMNHWGSAETGLVTLQSPILDYMWYTWMPRGAETAELLYNGDGWVTHDEMNIFGHTG
jgi:alpha-L-fucosidase 2